MSDAIVVGSGPNGLAAAAALAARGVRVTVLEAMDAIGGGTRSSELTLPGLVHDECSATHPMAVESPAYAEHDLRRHGLEWLWPDVDLAHPLDDGTAGAMFQSIDATVAALGTDGKAWKRVFGRPAAGFAELSDDIMHPFLHVPRHPLRLVGFGARAAMPATVLARSFSTERARALFGGVAGHAIAKLNLPMSSAVGMALVCAGHRWGWPVARGGSQAIADALAGVVRENGGTIETGRRVRSLSELPDADLVMLDLSPRRVLEIAGDRLPGRIARAYRRFRHGPGAFKVDLAVEEGVPWTAEAARRAGTVHVIGSFSELVAAERAVNRGRMPERPFVLVGQQYLADPGRSQGAIHPVWTYAHVPSGFDGDATDAILAQIERFAPGLRERIAGMHVRTTRELVASNPNFIGGDIVGGSNDPWQTVIRPRLALNPYGTGIPGVYICSAATPPGAGAHGVNGWNAAQLALRSL